MREGFLYIFFSHTDFSPKIQIFLVIYTDFVLDQSVRSALQYYSTCPVHYFRDMFQRVGKYIPWYGLGLGFSSATFAYLTVILVSDISPVLVLRPIHINLTGSLTVCVVLKCNKDSLIVKLSFL